MTLQECYKMMESDYEDVLGRLYKEELVKKFVIKFLSDPSYDNLCKAMEERNRREAFRASHTMKGVCQNLSFTRLYESSKNLTEALREDWGANVNELFEQTSEDYKQTVAAIREFEASEQRDY